MDAFLRAVEADGNSFTPPGQLIHEYQSGAKAFQIYHVSAKPGFEEYSCIGMIRDPIFGL